MHTRLSDPGDDASISIERQGYPGMSDLLPLTRFRFTSHAFPAPTTSSTAAWP
jgi:hypothetical protein